MSASNNTPAYEVHEGLDYVVVLAPDDTTDNATANFREADVARQFVRIFNAHENLVRRVADVLEGLEDVKLGGAMPARIKKLHAALKKAGT